MKRCKWLMMSSVLLLLMWSCSSDNDAPENGEEVPILLSSSFSSATRAGHEDEIDPEATAALRNFWVYGYKTVAGNDIQMMNKQLVSRDAAGSPWTYSPLKYWDRAASNYLFVGYVPNNGVSINNSTKVLSFTDIPQWQPYSESVNTEDGIQTVYNSSANDYMVAKSTDSPANYLSSATNPYGVGYVHLDFRHLLSKLTIKAYCPPNEESAERTKYVIQNVSLGSKGYTTQGAGAAEVHTDILPASGYYRTASYDVNENEITVPSIATTGHEGHENEKLPLYYKADDKQDEYMMPSSGSESNPPCEVCSWLIAPFSLTERFTPYPTEPTKDPRFTIQVTYWAKTKNDTTGKFEYTSKVVSKSLELVNAADEPLFMEFEQGKEYVITLKIDKQLAEVLVDVSVIPWKESMTNASPHTVYNW